MIPYIGGKSGLSKLIIQNFPQDYVNYTYVEVFGGAGWVLYNKQKSKLEIYNDLNSNLTNLFQTIRDNYEEFKFKADWILSSREDFYKFKKQIKENDFKNNIDRAIAFAVLQVQSFGGKGDNWGRKLQSFGGKSLKWDAFIYRLESINKRLKSVQIENLDFEKLIKLYDTSRTLFYIDPPYYDCEDYYNKNGNKYFVKEDHERLANVLQNIKGKFIVSYYEHKDIYELYKDYNYIKKDKVKTLAKHARSIGKELLILNYNNNNNIFNNGL